MPFVEVKQKAKIEELVFFKINLSLEMVKLNDFASRNFSLVNDLWFLTNTLP